MAGLESLSRKQKTLLKHMGVTLWYARREADSSSVPEQTIEVGGSDPQPAALPRVEAQVAVSSPSLAQAGVPETTETAEDRAETRPEPIAFCWLAGTRGLLIHEPAEDSSLKCLIDIVAFMDWRCGGKASDVGRGLFRWPQLETSRGTPERPLRAFFGQHAADWYIVDRRLAERFTALGVLPEGAKVVEDLERVYLDAERKRALWAKLQS